MAAVELLQSYRDIQPIVQVLFAVNLVCILSLFYTYRILRKRSTSEIESLTACLRDGLANTSDGIIAIDEQGIIQNFTVAADKLFQYTAGEVNNQYIDNIVPTSYTAIHTWYINQSDNKDKSKYPDKKPNLNGLGKDGRLFPINMSVNEIQRSDNKIIIATIDDKTNI